MSSIAKLPVLPANVMILQAPAKQRSYPFLRGKSIRPPGFHGMGADHSTGSTRHSWVGYCTMAPTSRALVCVITGKRSRSLRRSQVSLTGVSRRTYSLAWMRTPLQKKMSTKLVERPRFTTSLSLSRKDTIPRWGIKVLLCQEARSSDSPSRGR